MEMIFTVGIMAFLGLMFFLTTGMGTETIAGDALGARGFPIAMIVLGLALCVLIIIKQSKAKKEAGEKLLDLRSPEGRAVLATVAALVGYLALLNIVGYIISTLLFSMLAARVAGYRKPFVLVLFAVLLTCVLFLLFGKVFFVPLPRGLGPLRELSYLLY